MVDQAPPPGSAWTRGDRVGLTLAAGRTVAVPDVAGYALDAATKVIAGMGLAVGEDLDDRRAGPPTIVLSQDPAARSVVSLGAAVALVVRAGVPNLLGLTEAAARTALDAAGVSLDHEGDGGVAPGPVGVVLSQTPAPGTAVTAGTKVTLVLSIAPRVVVPALVGDSLADATAALGAVGLGLLVSGNEESSTSPEGSILEQDPAAGTRVDRGTTVRVVIAVAPPKVVPVPNLLGKWVDAAKAALTGVGLGLTVAAERPTPGTPAGIVVAQDPAAGTSIVVGTAVSVTVSATDPSVEVPDVRQQSSANAQALLGQVSLRLQVTGSQSTVQAAGFVLTQDPVAGSRVPTGSAVSVVMSAGGLVVVPQLLGMAQGAAVQTLKGLNLGFDSEVVVNLSRPPGAVIAQDPSAGAQVPFGTVVFMTVSTRLTRPPNGEPQIQPRLETQPRVVSPVTRLTP